MALMKRSRDLSASRHLRPSAGMPGLRTILAGLMAAVTLAVPARANVRLPKLISDHMVLQRDAKVPIWGWAAADEEVAVTLAGQTKTARASAQGKWRVSLDKL